MPRPIGVAVLARTDSRARALFLLIITAMLATLVGGGSSSGR